MAKRVLSFEKQLDLLDHTSDAMANFSNRMNFNDYKYDTDPSSFQKNTLDIWKKISEFRSKKGKKSWKKG